MQVSCLPQQHKFQIEAIRTALTQTDVAFLFDFHEHIKELGLFQSIHFTLGIHVREDTLFFFWLWKPCCFTETPSLVGFGSLGVSFIFCPSLPFPIIPGLHRRQWRKAMGRQTRRQSHIR